MRRAAAPSSRLGQAYLTPRGILYLVVSEPWYHDWGHWRHNVVAFYNGEPQPFHSAEDSFAEFSTRPGWIRLA